MLVSRSRVGALAHARRLAGVRAASSLVTFGEALLTYKPVPAGSTGALPLSAGTTVQVQAVGGAELNTAVAFARLCSGREASFVSVLPNTALGDHVVNVADSAGVATDENILRVSGTIGTVRARERSIPHHSLTLLTRRLLQLRSRACSFTWSTRAVGQSRSTSEHTQRFVRRRAAPRSIGQRGSRAPSGFT